MKVSLPFLLSFLLLFACKKDDAPAKVYPPLTNDPIAAQVLKQGNDYRATISASALTNSAVIEKFALQHSYDMAITKTLNHDGFNTRVDSIGTYISYKSAGENVAYGPYDAAYIVSAWLNSPDHKAAIEGNYNLTGIGVVKDSTSDVYYYTQIFIRK